MFKIIDRYLIVTTIKYIGIVFLFVLGMEFFVLLVGELSDIGQGTYHFWQAIFYVLLSLPANVYTLFPMVALLGSLIGLGLLGMHSELIVLRSNGLSLWRISRPILLIALVLGIGMSLIGEVIGTSMQNLADKYKVTLVSNGQAISTHRGLWIRSGNSFIHIDKVYQNNKLQGIAQFDFNNQQQMIRALYANNANLINNQWQLQQVRVSNLSDKQVTTQALNKMVWPVQIDAHLLTVSAETTNELNLFDLLKLAELRKQNGLGDRDIIMSFWQRSLQPLATLVMILLALSFVFGSLRNITMGFRMVMGISLGFTFYLMNEFVAPLVLVYQIPVLIGAAAPIILFAILAYVLIQRVK